MTMFLDSKVIGYSDGTDVAVNNPSPCRNLVNLTFTTRNTGSILEVRTVATLYDNGPLYYYRVGQCYTYIDNSTLNSFNVSALYEPTAMHAVVKNLVAGDHVIYGKFITQTGSVHTASLSFFIFEIG